MSHSGSCENNGSPGEEVGGQADDILQATLSADDGDPPSATSRISVKHAVLVMGKFSEYKRWLVEEIGFGGMLKLPLLHKLNLKYSAWIMSKVSVSQQAIFLKQSKILRFWAADVHKVFGIPCGKRQVTGRDAAINPKAVNFIKNTIGMNRTGVHSLRAAEDFLLRDITEESSKLEKDCFQIAFVIFVMGLVLVPKTKHDYATIDFWGALGNTEIIAQFNWCQYVLDKLLDAVTKLKKDISMNNISTNLTGCHLFFQIFLLDSVDLGMFNKTHDVLPRISVFDQESLRRMIVMAADPVKGSNSWSYASLRDPSTVCYTWSQHVTPQLHNSHTTLKSRKKRSDDGSVGHSMAQTSRSEQGDPLCRAPPVDAYTIGQATANIGPMDFGNYIRDNYPKLVADEITLLLKKHNARSLLHLSNARQSMMKDMLVFADELYSSLSRRCVCCAAHGFGDCPLAASKHVQQDFSTPLANKIVGKRLDLSGCGGKECDAQGSMIAKRNTDLSNKHQTEKRVRVGSPTSDAISSKLSDFCKSTMRSIAQMYADLPAKCPAVVYGQSTKIIPKRKYVFQHGYPTDPWRRGCVPYPSPPDVGEQIEQYFNNSPPEVLGSLFIIHESPRFIRVTGVAIKQQLVGDRLLDHELTCILFRRFTQADTESNRDSPYLSWRHNLEADFSSLVLSDSDYIHSISIHKQLLGQCFEYDITSVQMFFLPVPLQDGWLLVMWDMSRKTTHVIDPLVRGHAGNPVVKERQELAARKLHTGLFNCLNELYAGWPVLEDNWSTVFPDITEAVISKFSANARSAATCSALSLSNSISKSATYLSQSKSSLLRALIELPSVFEDAPMCECPPSDSSSPTLAPAFNNIFLLLTMLFFGVKKKKLHESHKKDTFICDWTTTGRRMLCLDRRGADWQRYVAPPPPESSMNTRPRGSTCIIV